MLKRVNGYKTYIGIVITIFGITGLSKYITGEQLSVVLNGLIDIAGIIITIIGAIHKDIKISEAEQY
jgi:hypothetical protein